MKKTRFEQMQDQINITYGGEQGERIRKHMIEEYESLCKAYEKEPAAMSNHMHNNIFPVVTAFHALMDEGIDRGKAAEQASSSFLKLMDAPANAIRKALKVPGLYRLMPWLWKTLMPKMFGEDAGFRFKFYPTDKKRVKFDMLECPYYRICKELNCEEIAPTFCTTDDICYGHMHPKLIWNRTKTLARGGDKCDFDLYIPEK